VRSAPALVVRGDARLLPLADASVDLIVTSPPFFSLRSYRDNGEHFAGQIGSEPTPADFLDALWAVTAECTRVLKPSGSMFVNLGDKYAGSGGHNNATLSRHGTGSSTLERADKVAARNVKATRRQAPDRYIQACFGRPKSLMLLPERYRIGCVDRLGLIARAVIVHSKPNGLPESVQDRVRRSHEDWVHLTKQPHYFSAVDEIREPHTGGTHPAGPNATVTKWQSGGGEAHRTGRSDPEQFNPLGRLPGSVWSIASEPLIVPKWAPDVDHFAAFAQELPRRFILGWSPSGICTGCGEGLRPIVEMEHERYRRAGSTGRPKSQELGGAEGNGRNGVGYPQTRTTAEIRGYECACWSDDDEPDPEGFYRNAPRTRPSVVLDPFAGTGTTVMVARVLGRIGIGVDLSMDYCRLARWRVFESGHGLKSLDRTMAERQMTLPMAPAAPAVVDVPTGGVL
jgi:hypothetical protein